MTKTIDPHGEALDLLDEERYLLEDALTNIKPRIRQLNRFRTAGDFGNYEIYSTVYGGNISVLTKFQNNLRERLHSVDATRKLLKEDRADQLQDAWDEAQYILAATENESKPFLPCGCW